MTEIKICGIRTPEALDAAAAAGADWVGFVFVPASPRAVTIDEAAALLAGHAGSPRPVGLFVDPNDALLAEGLAGLPLQALQIYAPAARAAEIEARFGVPVWHAVGVDGPGDLPRSAPGVSRILLDHKPPLAAAIPGGNATAFDWSLLRSWTAPCAWVLAGGLTPGNVAEAIAATGAPMVDVSSGVERSRGVKDPGLIRAFIAAARIPQGVLA